MDKYTYSLKTNKIQDLVRKGDYETAAKIADTMEWNQERNVRLLNAAAEAYEKMERTEDAMELLLKAYDRSAAGKRILYKLTELALSGDKLKDAETFYKKYLEEAGDDSDRFILRYRIAEAKGESNARKISILEAYNRQEFEEEWACTLAELYCEEDMKEKCVKLCDEIILWFSAGPFVQRALDLKEHFEPLTAEQRDRRENRAYYEAQVERVAEEMAELNKGEEEGLTEADAKNGEYSASIDSSLIQELMEEEIREAEAQATAAEAEERLIEAAAQIREAEAAEEARMEAEEAAAEEETPEEPAEEKEPELTPEQAAAIAQAEADIAELAGDASARTRNLQDDPEWKEAFREIMEETDDPTREIVIPKELLNQVAVPETEESEEEPEAPETEAEEEVPAEEIREELACGFDHEHCIFLDNENGEATVDKAVDALDDYYSQQDREMSPLAKISAAKLNKRGLIRSLPQLNHKDLIIDGAGALEDEILREILEILDGMDPEKMFVLMDSEDQLTRLRIRMQDLSHIVTDLPKIVMTETEGKAAPQEREEADREDPEEERKAAARAKAKKARDKVAFANIDPDQVLSERDFIRYAEYFARELECSIDDSGFDALDELMEEILEDNGDLTAGDVEDIIEDAADDAEKGGLKRMFAAKYDEEGFLILRKKNFG